MKRNFLEGWTETLKFMSFNRHNNKKELLKVKQRYPSEGKASSNDLFQFHAFALKRKARFLSGQHFISNRWTPCNIRLKTTNHKPDSSKLTSQVQHPYYLLNDCFNAKISLIQRSRPLYDIEPSGPISSISAMVVNEYS